MGSERKARGDRDIEQQRHRETDRDTERRRCGRETVTWGDGDEGRQRRRGQDARGGDGDAERWRRRRRELEPPLRASEQVTGRRGAGAVAHLSTKPD